MGTNVLLALVVLLALAAGASPGAAAVAPTQADVEYAAVGGISLKLDAYIPPGPGPFPALIMIHGGGWWQGDKAGLLSLTPEVPPYLARGIACFSINYRLSGQAPYPAAVDDCLAAVRWVRQHAADYKVNPDRLAVIGGSSGGHLALMVATAQPGEGDVDSKGQPLKSLVVAAASLSGPTDLAAMANGGPNARNIVTRFLGGTPEQIPDKYAEASPLNHVTADTAPTILVYGLDDTLVVPDQATSMADKLKAAGVPVVLAPMAGRKHEVAVMNLPPVLRFLVIHLKG